MGVVSHGVSVVVSSGVVGTVVVVVANLWCFGFFFFFFGFFLGFLVVVDGEVVVVDTVEVRLNARFLASKACRESSKPPSTSTVGNNH